MHVFRGALVLAGAALLAARLEAQASPPPLQAVVSVTLDWDSTAATVLRYQRASAGDPWKLVGKPVDAAVGRTGLAWGRGLAEPGEGPVKREGDGRAPAGIFALGPAFGYAPADSVPWIRLPYVHSLASVKCVDDPASRAYNRLVDQDTMALVDWTSHEEMRLDNDVYRFGAWVSHNDGPPLPGAGSCIFLHVWRGPGVPTVGCTAMAEENLVELLAWLDPRAHPVLVQAPRDALDRLLTTLGIPLFP